MSGFIYLWYDRKHRRYYLGKHWGHEKDGYVCSSKWMNKAYKRRRDDFHRRTLEKINTNQKDLALAEARWGSYIKKEELGNRYYNLKRPGDDAHWSSDPFQKKTVGQKISEAKTGFRYSDESKRKMSEAQTGKKRPRDQVEKIRKANTGRKRSEESRQKMSEIQMGHSVSKETRRKISKARKGKPGTPHTEETKAKLRGRKLSEETKRKISEARRKNNETIHVRSRPGRRQRRVLGLDSQSKGNERSESPHGRHAWCSRLQHHEAVQKRFGQADEV